MTPTLNWRELELLLEKIRPEIENLFVDRMIVPERLAFPQGYLKGEFAIRLTGRKNEGVLLISIRPRHPYIAWSPGKGPKASSKATRSPFDLSLSKNLKGARLLEVQTIPKERIAVLWFSEEGKSKNRLGLVLVFIPAVPEAYLVSVPLSQGNSFIPAWPILARSRTIRDESKLQKSYSPPDGSQAPQDPPIREQLVATSTSFFPIIEKELKIEAFQHRLQAAEKSLRGHIKQAHDRLKQSETSLTEAEKEKDWQKLGDLLKSSMGSSPEIENGVRKVLDYETGESVQIPCDPKLSLKEQVEKFYHNARRKQRRIEEARLRAEGFKSTLQQLEKTLAYPLQPGQWSELEKLERLAGIRAGAEVTVTEGKAGKKQLGTAWLGKTFYSREGLSIWVGRSKDENLELTFKCARGNDLWMHVRGRPGAHVVVPLQAGKSASLETLLDAATLAIFYSGGENWGKTEVDYTFKKYVKRIKDSTEASYTHNKTLLVEPELERRKRLLDQLGSK